MAEADAPPMILWDEVNKKLPTAQEPDIRQARKALFKSLLKKGNKTLSLDDVSKGMRQELRHDLACSYVPGIGIPEMTKTIKLAFMAAADLAPPTKGDKKAAEAKTKEDTAKVNTGIAHAKSNAKGSKNKDAKGKSVDKREFHAFLVALRYTLELVELFEVCDAGNEDDQKLSLRELLKGKDTLAEWGITEEMLKEQFEGVDSWTPHMKFNDFADWVMLHRMDSMQLHLDDSDDEEVQFLAASADLKSGVNLVFEDAGAESDLNRLKVRETFGEWDSDGSGGISFEELATVMKELNPTFTDTKVKLLFEAADTSKDGLIDFDEFLAFVFR